MSVTSDEAPPPSVKRRASGAPGMREEVDLVQLAQKFGTSLMKQNCPKVCLPWIFENPLEGLPDDNALYHMQTDPTFHTHSIFHTENLRRSDPSPFVRGTKGRDPVTTALEAVGGPGGLGGQLHGHLG